LTPRHGSDSGQTNATLGSSPLCAAFASHSDTTMHRQIATPAFIASFATFELSASRRIGLNSNIEAS
jgi:hypothetical protein